MGILPLYPNLTRNFMSKTKKRAVLVLSGCLVCLILCLLLDAHWERTHRFGAKLLHADSIQEIIQGKQPAEFDQNLLVFNNEYLVPYDRSGGRVLLAQSRKARNWTGTLTTTMPDVFDIYLLQDDLWQNKQAAIGENHIFQIYLVSESTYMTSPVVICGGPILSLFGTADDSLSRMQLWNPDSELPSNEFIESLCKFHVRGNVSSLLSKKPYKLELCDADGNPVKHNLLDMREDDDWNLNSLFTDTSKIREKLGYTVWDTICKAENAPFNSSAVEYTEVLLNNEYQGLYGLMLPIDRKLFNMDADDTAFTFKSYEVPDETKFSASVHKELISGVEQKIGLEFGSVEEGWKPFEQYLRTFYWERNTENTLEQVAETVNVDSFLAYHLAVELLGAQDNVLKNIHLLNYAQPGSPNRQYKALWDINFSFGDTFVDGLELFTDTVVPTDWLSYDSDYLYLQTLAPEEINRRTAEKWNTYRGIGIDPENLCRLADAYMQQIQDSGAMARDTARWPESKNDTDSQEIKDWIVDRFHFLDAHYAAMAAG